MDSRQGNPSTILVLACFPSALRRQLSISSTGDIVWEPSPDTSVEHA